MPEELLICYNRGCGQKYKAEKNTYDSCTFHPGAPVFHDAYKGWSCCRKKCTDFTEFLNIKGCTISKHSNVKPPEPEKPVVDKDKAAEVVEVRAPMEAAPARLLRPSFDTPLTTVKPCIAASLVSQVESLIIKKPTSAASVGPEEIAVGTSCRHGGCKQVYQGPSVILGPCIYHPGVPVFHEGLKFWSCCTKRTIEFSAFLEQVGCVSGEHQWTAEEGARAKPVCRHDWHQTGNHVIISIYAKKYDPERSSVQLNPIRAKINLVFPEDESKFEMDLKLRGVVDVDRSEVSMLGTKVEIKLRKAELGSWATLELPRPAAPVMENKPKLQTTGDAEIYDDDPVDLSELN